MVFNTTSHFWLWNSCSKFFESLSFHTFFNRVDCLQSCWLFLVKLAVLIHVGCFQSYWLFSMMLTVFNYVDCLQSCWLSSVMLAVSNEGFTSSPTSTECANWIFCVSKRSKQKKWNQNVRHGGMYSFVKCRSY